MTGDKLLYHSEPQMKIIETRNPYVSTRALISRRPPPLWMPIIMKIEVGAGYSPIHEEVKNKQKKNCDTDYQLIRNI